jgi:hypothetical protein
MWKVATIVWLVGTVSVAIGQPRVIAPPIQVPGVGGPPVIVPPVLTTPPLGGTLAPPVQLQPPVSGLPQVAVPTPQPGSGGNSHSNVVPQREPVAPPPTASVTGPPVVGSVSSHRPPDPPAEPTPSDHGESGEDGAWRSAWLWAAIVFGLVLLLNWRRTKRR